MYQNTIFHTLLLTLSTILSGINLIGIKFMKNKFEEETMITSIGKKFIASNKTVQEMIPVPKSNTGKHHSRFDSTELDITSEK